MKPDGCETNYDCERPMVCCDLIVARVCCSSGLGLGPQQQGQRTAWGPPPSPPCSPPGDDEAEEAGAAEAAPTFGRCNGNGYTVRTNLHSGVSAEPEPKPVLLVILLVILLVTTGKNRYYW